MSIDSELEIRISDNGKLCFVSHREVVMQAGQFYIRDQTPSSYTSLASAVQQAMDVLPLTLAVT